MPSIKEYNVKLTSLKNTQKITKTMKMVSASKLRKAHEAQKNAQLYASRLRELISRLAASAQSATHPLLQQRSSTGKILVVLFTSDRGLCGGFNNNLCRYLWRWYNENKDRFAHIELSCCGKRGYSFFSKRLSVRKHYLGVTERPGFDVALKIGEELNGLFAAGEYDEIYLAYNYFRSPLSQKPTLLKLLPIEATELEGGKAIGADCIFEPAEEELLSVLLPRSVFFKIYYTFLENSAGEHGARMAAMDSATSNARDLIKRYTLLRNRARQASITTELTEIVAGAEAL